MAITAPMIELRLYNGPAGRFLVDPTEIVGLLEHPLYTDIFIRGHGDSVRVYESVDSIQAKIKEIEAIAAVAQNTLYLTQTATATKKK